MKKLLLISALSCAIGISMVSGTTAKYTQTLEEQTSNVTAKSMKIHSTSNETFTDFEIAPGEKKEFVFTVTNTEKDGKTASEVPLNAIFSLKRKDNKTKGSNFAKNIEVEVESKDFALKVERDDDKELDNNETVKGTASFKEGIVETKVIKVIIEWDVGKNEEINFDKVKDEKVSLELNLRAEQI